MLEPSRSAVVKPGECGRGFWGYGPPTGRATARLDVGRACYDRSRTGLSLQGLQLAAWGLQDENWENPPTRATMAAKR
jgi:hypothetical protein